MTLQHIINKREIKHLVHFTTILNLESILKHCLYSHLDWENDVVDAYINDGYGLKD